MTLLLNDSALEALVDMPATVQAVEDVFRATALGQALVPAPASLPVPGGDGRFLAMIAIAEDPQLVAVKLLGDLPDNAVAGLPTQRSMIMLVDAANGCCRAILAGRVPTRERTAAASAVATRHLARPDARTLGLVGAGALAVAHVRSHQAVLELDRVLVWSRSAATQARFAEQTAGLGVEIVPVATPEAVFDADVVCTLTPSRTPLVCGSWFRTGQHVNVVGAPPRADHREVDDEAVRRANVFVDSLETALAKSGDVCLPLAAGVITRDHISNELGDVIAGKITGRTHPEDITLFDSVGLATQDLAIGALFLAAAERTGSGQCFEPTS